jgi:hypothetical protein
MAWVRRSLGTSFPEGSFSFARQILWMVLMEIFSRAGNRTLQLLGSQGVVPQQVFLMYRRMEFMTS